MPDASAGPGLIDPAGLGDAVARLSAADRRAGRAAFFVIALALEPGERVELVVQCRYQGADGAVALTDRRLLVANAREWQPDVSPVGLQPGLTIEGWQDERTASLVFERDGNELVVDQIGNRALAQELAAAIRSRTD